MRGGAAVTREGPPETSVFVGVSEQLTADEGLQQAARVNDKGNFEVPFQEALDDALVSRHEKHRDFINKLFQDETLGAFFREAMLDQIYGRLAASGESGPAI